MKVTTDDRPAIPPVTLTFETRAEMLAMLDMIRTTTSLFYEGSLGDKLNGELYGILDQHINKFGGHRKADKDLTGGR